MKKYLVFMCDINLAPLTGSNPRGGCTQDFDDLKEANKYADGIGENWERIFIFKRDNDGTLETIQRRCDGVIHGKARSQEDCGKDPKTNRTTGW